MGTLRPCYFPGRRRRHSNLGRDRGEYEPNHCATTYSYSHAWTTTSTIAYVSAFATDDNYSGSIDAAFNDIGRCSASTDRSGAAFSSWLDASCFRWQRNPAFNNIRYISGFTYSWL